MLNEETQYHTHTAMGAPPTEHPRRGKNVVPETDQ